MTITIFAHGHFPEDLNQNFENLFKKCDILVVENAVKEFYGEIKNHFNQLSQRGHSDYRLHLEESPEEYRRKLEEFIKNSKKQIEVEISPVSSEEVNKSKEDLSSKFFKAFVNGKLEEACSKMLELCQFEVEISKKKRSIFRRTIN